MGPIEANDEQLSLPPQPGGSRLPRALGMAICVVAASHVASLWLDPRPLTHDDAWYAETSLRFLDVWAGGGAPAAAQYFAEKTFCGIKAPLIILLPQPLLLLFGRHDFVFPLANVLCLGVAMAYLGMLTARIAREWCGPALAALALALMPLAVLTTRRFFVEDLSTALVLMTIYHLWRSDGFRHGGHTLAAGAAMGLGMLAKVTYPVFIVGPLLLVAWRAAADVRGRMVLVAAAILALVGPAVPCVAKYMGIGWGVPAGVAFSLIVLVALRLKGDPRMWNVAAASSLAAWLTLIWYLPNAQTAVAFAYSNSVGEISKDYGAAEIFSWPAIRDFWISIVNEGCGLALAGGLVLAGLATLAAVLVPGGDEDARKTLRRGLGLVVAWLLPPLLAFTLGRNRTTRFVLPMLPALGLLLGVLIAHVQSRWRTVAGSLAVVWLVAAAGAYAVITVGGPTIRLSPGSRLVLCAPDLAGPRYAGQPAPPREAVLQATRAVVGPRSDRPVFAMMLSDTPYLNQNTMLYEAAKRQAPYSYGLFQYGNPFADALVWMSQADVLLYQEGPGSYAEFTNQRGRQVLEMIRRGELPGWRPLDQPVVSWPGGGSVRFIAKAEPASQLGTRSDGP